MIAKEDITSTSTKNLAYFPNTAGSVNPMPAKSISGSAIPPPAENRRAKSKSDGASIITKLGSSNNSGAGFLDLSTFTRALLKDLKDAKSCWNVTPGGSPCRKRQRVYGDRFIPNREGQDLLASFSLLYDDGTPGSPSDPKKRIPHNELGFQKMAEADKTYKSLLRSEIFDTTIPRLPSGHMPNSSSNSTSFTPFYSPSRSKTPPSSLSHSVASLTPSTPHKNLFSYMSPRNHAKILGHPTPSRTPQSRNGVILDSTADIYSLSPVRYASQQILLSPRKTPRAVNKLPFKVLDAPDLADDFYLNLVDWGNNNTLGVGLGRCVYLWDSSSGRVNKLCELTDDIVTSVSWIQRGSHIAVGTDRGYVQIWDAEKLRRLRTMTGHKARVGALAWNDHILTSGSRDRLIYHRDVRAPDQWLRQLVGHKQEVCGLKWNSADGQLASGGNDNKLIVWDKLESAPLWKINEHTAAVKAITWSPHQRGILASGGGTADRRIIIHDTIRGTINNQVDAGSQVCNLAWSKNSNEIVSTHGYSQNQVIVWKCPSMQQVASLTGHTYRVLYLAMSPDGKVIVTGAGDETLRFWNVFGRKLGTRSDSDSGDGDRLGDWGVIR